MKINDIAYLVGIVAALAGIASMCAPQARAEPGQVMWVADLNRPALEVPAAFATGAVAVAWCESRWNPEAVNPTSGATGLFQLMPIHEKRVRRMGFQWSDMLRGEPNVRVAIAIWSEQSWRPWACAASGVVASLEPPLSLAGTGGICAEPLQREQELWVLAAEPGGEQTRRPLRLALCPHRSRGTNQSLGGWKMDNTVIATHKGHDIYLTAKGLFTFTDHGESISRPSLAAAKKAIDKLEQQAERKATPVKLMSRPAVSYTHTIRTVIVVGIIKPAGRGKYDVPHLITDLGAWLPVSAWLPYNEADVRDAESMHAEYLALGKRWADRFRAAAGLQYTIYDLERMLYGEEGK